MAQRRRSALPARPSITTELERDLLNHALHRSVVAYLGRMVPDPEHPGQTISYGDLEQRLRGRCYRAARPPRQQPATDDGGATRP